LENQPGKKNRRGLKIVFGLLSVIVLGVSVYVYSVYHNVNNTAEAIYTPVETEDYRNFSGTAATSDSATTSAVSTAASDAATTSDSTATSADSTAASDAAMISDEGAAMTNTEAATNPSELVEQGESISILLLGIDTGDLGRTEQGRSDSMIVATINPNTEKTTLLSIPRDTYAEIVGYGTWDKINHAYAFGGTAMSINSVQNLLNIPIDFYVSVNMEGIKEVVDAVGGVDVNSPIAFNQNGYDFVVGTNHLDGEAALSFSRMRYEDPAGDTGRQGRQRLVIEAVLRKLATPETLMNYQTILASLSANVQTNFQMTDYLSLRSNDYLASANNIQQEQLGGAGGMMDGIYYNFVDDAELARVQSLMQGELELD
jgi:LCP family protein required for cell wall assembly